MPRIQRSLLYIVSNRKNFPFLFHFATSTLYLTFEIQYVFPTSFWLAMECLRTIASDVASGRQLIYLTQRKGSLGWDTHEKLYDNKFLLWKRKYLLYMISDGMISVIASCWCGWSLRLLASLLVASLVIACFLEEEKNLRCMQPAHAINIRTSKQGKC